VLGGEGWFFMTELLVEIVILYVDLPFT
jgi:hypothetical protein